MTNVLVTHPGLQHSHQLAWALQEHNLLGAYWSGVPTMAYGETWPALLPKGIRARIKHAEIPLNRREHFPTFAALTKLATFARAKGKLEELEHHVFHAFDRAVAGRIERIKPRAVIGYENSSLRTFRAAKKYGALCILDAASFHHATGSALGVTPDTKFRRAINRYKDEEVALADAIITCSPIASKSYIDAGVPSAKVHHLLLGAALPERVRIRERSVGPVKTFLFAGSLSYRKSVDVIIQTFDDVASAGLPYRLEFIGGDPEGLWARRVLGLANTTYTPSLPQAQLYERMAAADCLLLPSRFDSFGMVVPEAMACGTPAIVSTCTGARALIDESPGSGWVIEPSAENLTRLVRTLILQPELLVHASADALATAKRHTWQAYRHRAASLIRRLLHENEH